MRHRTMGWWLGGAVALLVMLGAGMAWGEESYPRLCNVYFGSLDGIDLEQMASWDLLVLAKRAEDLNAAELAELRSLNPDITMVAHMAVGYGREYDYPPINADLSAAVTENNWWMLDTAGERVTFGTGNMMMNMTLECPVNGEGQRLCDWLPGYIYERLYQGGKWDGVFLDYCVERIAWLDPYLPNPIDHDLDGQSANPDSLNESWRLGMRKCVQELRALVGDDYLLVCNGNNTLYDLCDGDTRENFPNMHGDWFDNMFNEEHGYLAFEALYRHPTFNIINMIWDGELLADGYPARWGNFNREFRFALTSTLVFGEGYFSCDGPVHGEIWWFEYYDIDLGAPVSRAEDCDVRTALQPYGLEYLELVKKRRFESGIAVINPTRWTQDVFLGGSYYDVHSWNGEFYSNSGIRTQVHLYSQDGEVLVGAGVVLDHCFDEASAAMEGSSVVLDWNSVDGAESYSVYKSKALGDGTLGPKVLLAVTDATTYTDESVSQGDYRYFIAPIDSDNCEGRFSRAIAVSTEPGSDQSVALMVDEPGEEPALNPEDPPSDESRGLSTSLTSVRPVPATSEATIAFTADDERWGGSDVSITVYDVSGRLVRRLHDGPLEAGEHETHWDLRNERGIPVASGCYLVVVEGDGQRESAKALVLR